MYDVLIVEDDPMVLMINKQYVAQNPGFNIIGVARDGQSALDFLSSQKVDLIILDCYMPKKSGIEVLREIRQKEIPVSVIMVTAANNSQIIEEALRLGVVDYLVKPFTANRFNQALSAFLLRQDAFESGEVFNQQSLDQLISGGITGTKPELPKGIQEVTLIKIKEYLKSNASGREMTGDEIAGGMGISSVTIRRYMNYLIETGEVSGRMNYETGGRPCMLYLWTKV